MKLSCQDKFDIIAAAVAAHFPETEGDLSFRQKFNLNYNVRQSSKLHAKEVEGSGN